MSRTTQTAITQLRQAADMYAVEFPEPVRLLLDLDLDLPKPEQNSAAVSDILDAFADDSAAGRKKIDQILDGHARALAAKALLPDLNNTLTVRRWSAIMAHRDEILAAFSEATRDDFDELAAKSAAVPFGTALGSVLPALALTVDLGEKLAARVQKAASALLPLYTSSDLAGSSGFYARHALLSIPASLDHDRRFGLALALRGERWVHEFTPRQPALWWAGVPAFGASFELATREDFRANLAALADVRPPSTNKRTTDPTGLVLT